MKTNQFRAMMLVLLMAVVSLGMVNAQAITVSGTVTDAKDGTPLVGCSVQIKGTTKGTVTNMNGRYTIQAKKGETLLFQYIGYKQERRVVKSATLRCDYHYTIGSTRTIYRGRRSIFQHRNTLNIIGIDC